MTRASVYPKYLGETTHGESVYRQSKGAKPTSRSGTEAVRCRYCNRWILNAPDRTCDGCWEVTSRISDFIAHPAGRAFVIEALYPAAPKEEGK